MARPQLKEPGSESLVFRARLSLRWTMSYEPCLFQPQKACPTTGTDGALGFQSSAAAMERFSRGSQAVIKAMILCCCAGVWSIKVRELFAILFNNFCSNTQGSPVARLRAELLISCRWFQAAMPAARMQPSRAQWVSLVALLT